MKILVLSDFYSNYSGNFIPSLVSFKKKANSIGHEVIFGFSRQNMSKEFLLWERPFEEENAVRLFDFRSKSFVREATSYINEENVDIVYYHFGSSIKLSRIKKRCKKSVVFFQHIHNSMFLKKDLFVLLKRIRNYFFLDHDIVKICCSHAIEDSARFMFPKSKVTVVHNAIDFSRLSPSPRNNCDSFNILLFGHNFYVKGVDIAISAVLALQSKVQAHLDIVMGDRMEENKKTIEAIYGSVPECVSLLPPSQNVAKLYKSHRVFLNASREEGMSYANIEAYYCGALFVASDIPQNKEPDLPNVNYFKSNDSNDLQKVLLHLSTIKNDYCNDTKYVEDHFSLETWAESVMKVMDLF